MWTPVTKTKRAFLTVALTFFFLILLWPLPKRARHPQFSSVVTASDGTLLKAYLSEDSKWRIRANIDDLPAHLVQGLLCLEDQRFYWHPGVDPLAVLRAFKQNYIESRIVSGASTITMQVARLLEPNPRGWKAKLKESLRAIRLETQLSKNKILELYLSYAPFGGNIEGIEAAAYRYFEKPAKSLSPAEVAFLFLLPQAPMRWELRNKIDLLKARNRNLERLKICGVIDDEDLNRFSKMEIPKASQWRQGFSELAPHLADFVNQKSPLERTKTTIDSRMQMSTENLVKSNEVELRAHGILNVGLIVVENSTGEIKVAIGNFELNRGADAQNYASFLIPRSTGSLLKPFIYGRLLETGELLPDSLLEDVPIDINGYQPQNYNGEFHGLVEAKMALANSYNVPWIRVLKEHGVDAFLSFLLSAGIKPPQKPSEIGLSLAVGGLQLSLLDLAKIYRSIANDGMMSDLNWIEGEAKKMRSWSWLNPAAAHLVREALKIRGRPDFAIENRNLSHPSVRWKTGTSQGNRDAWAFGMDPDYTVGVWLGNLNQEAAPSLVGPEVAAPIMFDTFSRIRKQNPSLHREWYATGFESIDVCAFSGLPAGPACANTTKVLGIKGLAMRKRCPYHHHILVDEKSGLQITKDCELPGMNPMVRSDLDLPADVANWTEKQMAGLKLAPKFHSACVRRPVSRGGLKIISPENKTYVIHSGESRLSFQMPLKIKMATSSQSLKCFLNGDQLNDSIWNEAAPFRVQPGEHTVVCADEQGRSDQVEFSVEL